MPSLEETDETMPIEPFIDAHSYIWTPDLAHYPLAQGFTVENMKPPSFTAEELLALCRPAGVGRVNLIQMSFYAFEVSCMPRFSKNAATGPGLSSPGRGADPLLLGVTAPGKSSKTT